MWGTLANWETKKVLSFKKFSDLSQSGLKILICDFLESEKYLIFEALTFGAAV